jgi:hypothetical protein
MDFLLGCAERVQESVFFGVASLLNLEVDVVFFDTTSTYFEIDVDDPIDDGDNEHDGSLRRLGHSNECPRQCVSSYWGVSNSPGWSGLTWI